MEKTNLFTEFLYLFTYLLHTNIHIHLILLDLLANVFRHRRLSSGDFGHNTYWAVQHMGLLTCHRVYFIQPPEIRIDLMLSTFQFFLIQTWS